jgi:hypothetical protein
MTPAEYREATERIAAHPWHVVGDLGEIVRALGGDGHVFVVKRKRGGFALVGHWQVAHVEAGPFASELVARKAWPRIRAEIEVYRKARTAAIKAGQPVPFAAVAGTGWAAQPTLAPRCSGCRRRVERRERANGAPDPVPASRPRAAIVRRAPGRPGGFAGPGGAG